MFIGSGRAAALLPIPGSARTATRNWEFDDTGLMIRRIASINDLPIEEADRKYHWELGRRPDDHPGLSELGL